MFSDDIYLPKETFTSVLKAMEDAENNSRAFLDIAEALGEDELYGGLLFNMDAQRYILSSLLRPIAKDARDIIEWWCFDKDFGRSVEDGDVVEAETGNTIPLGTAEALHDFLVKDAYDPKDLVYDRFRKDRVPFPFTQFHESQQNPFEYYRVKYGLGNGDITRFARVFLVEDYLEESDYVDFLFSDVFPAYEAMMAALKLLGAKEVFDIGGNHGFQSKIFTSSNISYTSVDPWVDFTYDGDEKARFIEKAYPSQWRPEKKGAAAVSRHCVGTRCFEDNGGDLDVFAEDFDMVAGIWTKAAHDHLAEKYDHSIVLETRDETGVVVADDDGNLVAYEPDEGEQTVFSVLYRGSEKEISIEMLERELGLGF